MYFFIQTCFLSDGLSMEESQMFVKLKIKNPYKAQGNRGLMKRQTGWEVVGQKWAQCE